MQTQSNLYLYLSRRDKKGIRLLAKFTGFYMMATRVNDLSVLNLPKEWLDQLNQIIYDSRLYWEPWLQSADSYKDLRNALVIRGFSNVLINEKSELVLSHSQNLLLNTSALPQKTTMIRKAF